MFVFNSISSLPFFISCMLSISIKSNRKRLCHIPPRIQTKKLFLKIDILFKLLFIFSSRLLVIKMNIKTNLLLLSILLNSYVILLPKMPNFTELPIPIFSPFYSSLSLYETEISACSSLYSIPFNYNSFFFFKIDNVSDVMLNLPHLIITQLICKGRLCCQLKPNQTKLQQEVINYFSKCVNAVTRHNLICVLISNCTDREPSTDARRAPHIGEIGTLIFFSLVFLIIHCYFYMKNVLSNYINRSVSTYALNVSIFFSRRSFLPLKFNYHDV